MPPSNVPDRNLALELVRVTEAAALAAARHVGRGDKEAADQAAVDGMHAVLHTIHMDGIVVIGEGEKDEAPMLANGEEVGDGSDPQVDIAVDPLEGTRLCALGMPNALAVIALAERGSMFDPGPCVYMEKMAGADDVADVLDLDRPLGETIGLVAERRHCEVGDVMVVVLDRPRHEEGIQAIREAGGRVRLITDGDVAGVLLAISPRTPATLLWGIGGTPEGVISAAGIKCMGGAMIGRLAPRDDEERKAAEDAGYDVDRILTHDDLVTGEDAFFSATGVTDGDVLQGVRYHGVRGRVDGVARHALALGHRAPHHLRPRPRQAAGADGLQDGLAPAAQQPGAERAARGRRRGGDHRDPAPRRVADRDRAVALLAHTALLRVGEAPDRRLLEVEARQRAQEAVRDEHVDLRLGVRVDEARSARSRSRGRSSRPRPRCARSPSPPPRAGSGGRRSRGSRRRCARAWRRAARRGCASARSRGRG